MPVRFMGMNWHFIVIAFILLSCFTTCQAIPAENRKAWIDIPIMGFEFPAGEPIRVLAHVYADAGVAEVQCAVDGIPFHRGPPSQPGGDFSTYDQDVIINDPRQPHHFGHHF